MIRDGQREFRPWIWELQRDIKNEDNEDKNWEEEDNVEESELPSNFKEETEFGDNDDTTVLSRGNTSRTKKVKELQPLNIDGFQTSG